MAVKKKKQPAKQKKHSNDKPQGHFCWVCGEHKAHEKFSGRGHATHMCKECHALPVAVRNEMVAIRKIQNMAFRYLNEQDINWLRKRLNDPRPEVKAAAREVHHMRFPRYERNMIKKGLTARSLEFFIHGEVWDEYGDEQNVHMRFFADNTGAFRRIDYNAPEGEQEKSIQIVQHVALKFLKAVVHQLNAPFWSEDLSDAEPGDYDPYLDILPEYRPDLYDDEEIDDDVIGDAEPESEDREPIWSLRLLLTKGMGEKTQTFYNQMHQEPQDLFWSLMGWFEPDEDDLDEYEENSEIDAERGGS